MAFSIILKMSHLIAKWWVLLGVESIDLMSNIIVRIIVVLSSKSFTNYLHESTHYVTSACETMGFRLLAWISFNSLRASDASDPGHHWFRSWLVAWPAPSHDLNKCWNVVNWTLWHKFQWNLNGNLHIFIQENTFENVVWEMSAILHRPQYANNPRTGK